MRLIDADKIGEVSADPYEERAFQDEIKSQPTVDAIPIEWIKNYLKTSPKMWQGYHDEELVEEMIFDWWKWEKENETN